MTTHFGVMVVFALFVSVVFATLMRDEPAEQLRLGARLFGGLVAGGVLAGLAALSDAVLTTARVRLWAPVAIYMAAIFYVSSLPQPPMPPGGDKPWHLLAYVGLGVVVASRGRRRSPGRDRLAHRGHGHCHRCRLRCDR